MATTAATTPLRFTPASLKRQHWVMLGREAALKRPGVFLHSVYGRPLVTFVDVAGELHVMDEACPHRGASLACGAVRDRAIVCPYHGMAFGAHSSPDRAYDYAVLQGLVWVDYAKDLLTQHTMPPYFPEFSSPDFRVTGFSRTLDANPVVLLECLLDWTPPALGPAPVSIKSSGADGRGARAYDTPHGPLVVETEYRLPFTACVRFTLDGAVLLVVMASLLPHADPVSPAHTMLHVHAARATSTAPAAQWLFGVVDAGAVADAADAARLVDPSQWSRNRLGPDDALLAAYREAMRHVHPDVLAFFVE